MEKPVKYVLTVLLSFLVLVGTSGFSFIVHHCNAGNFTEIRLTHQDCTGCCASEEQSCCNGTGQTSDSEENLASSCFSGGCCTEKALSAESLSEFTKNKESGHSAPSNISLLFEAPFGLSQKTSWTPSLNGLLHVIPINPGRTILALVQAFRL